VGGDTYDRFDTWVIRSVQGGRGCGFDLGVINLKSARCLFKVAHNMGPLGLAMHGNGGRGARVGTKIFL
jgi:hypothetical protein